MASSLLITITFFCSLILSLHIGQAFTILRIVSTRDFPALRNSPGIFDAEDFPLELAEQFMVPKKRAFDRLDVSNFELAGGFEDGLESAQLVKLKKANGKWGRRRR